MLRKAINQIHNLWFIIALLRITAWHAFHIWAKGNALRQNPFTADAVLVRWAEAIMQAVDAQTRIKSICQQA